ncbi:TadE family protein [Vibrio sp. 10N.286.51.E5]|uniref:TadE family protein n=1 Tax=Vibrio sp. 10N.286.51.E5 TaxID=3229709 RepID=UPI00354D39C9
MRRIVKYAKGSLTVEVALGIIILITATVMIFEMAYRIYVSNLVEFALRESVRSTTVFQGDDSYTSYNTSFFNVMNDESKLWSSLTPVDNFSMAGKYYVSYEDLLSDNYLNDADMLIDDSGYSFAEISLSYQYEPILPLLGGNSEIISSSVLLTLEHEGWESVR